MSKPSDSISDSPERAEAVEQVFQLVEALQDAIPEAEKYGVRIRINHSYKTDEDGERRHTVDAEVVTVPAYHTPGKY